MTQKEIAFNHLRRQLCVDDEAAIAELYNEFLASFPRKIAAARAALAAADWKRLEETAHTIKGDSAIVGLGQLRDLAMALQEAGKTRDRDSCRRLAEELERGFSPI